MTPRLQSAVDRASEIIRSAHREFGAGLVVVTSFQREGIVIVDLAIRALGTIPIHTIDTGRLPQATHDVMAEVEARYGLNVHRIRPDEAEVSAMVEKHGPDLFYDAVPLRNLCCNIRKVRPLALAMRDVSAYFTGLRRGQSETRKAVEAVDRETRPAKVSPLVDWTAADVAEYTAMHNLPVHKLYAAGYTSIGCDPCTRATVEGEDERAGRWWWENDGSRECGLHFSPEGKVERTADVLLREILEVADAKKVNTNAG